MNQQVAVQTSNVGINDMATGSAIIAAATQSVAKLFAKVRMMEKIRAERAELDKLSPRMLRDIGVDQFSVRRELERSYFDVPAGRW